MEAERVVLTRKPVQSATVAPSPNTAFKRKPIPVSPTVQPPTPVTPTSHGARDVPCPHCGVDGSRPVDHVRSAPADTFAEDAQRRISELEAEVKILTGKATAAADKLADYEDELQKLKAMRARTPSPSPAAGGSTPSPKPTVENLNPPQEEEDSVPPLPPPPPPQAAPMSRPGGLGRALTTTRITNFLAARRNSPASNNASPVSPANENGLPPTSEPDFGARLVEAETARKAAETKLAQTNQELEELSASLFQSANEMVSKERRQNAEFQAEAERKAKEREDQWQQWQKQVKMNDRAAASRARKLEEKVKKLEQRVQLLEDREKAKAERLERLEMAMKRTARVRSLIQPLQQPG